METKLRYALRVLSLPISPSSLRSGHLQQGNKRDLAPSILSLSHVLAGLMVMLGLLSAEQDQSESSNIVNWCVVMMCSLSGLVSSIVLLACGYQNIEDIRWNKMKEPSLFFRLCFLWIFGLADLLHFSVNLLVYMECVGQMDHITHVSFSIVTNIIMILFVIIQMVLITYYRYSLFKISRFVNISVVCIILANFSIWYNTVINNITTGRRISEYRNASCFYNSYIHNNLSRKIAPFLLPPRVEFGILASIFLISIWHKSLKMTDNLDKNSPLRYHYEAINCNEDDEPNDTRMIPSVRTGTSVHAAGIKVLAPILGILINMPICLSMLLSAVIYKWRNESVIIIMDYTEAFSAICTCVMVCICTHMMKKYCKYCQMPLTANEYILILSSSGSIAFFTIGLIAGLSGQTLTKSIIVSRLFGMLETYLQTHLFIKTRRFKTQGRSLGTFSFCGTILVISNSMYWILNSYNRGIFSATRFGYFNDKGFIRSTLIPLLTFYRFFSAMHAYTMYYRNKH